MTNKGTKHALLFSVISLLLCVAMLTGTTFAWFTDSVSSMNNIIKSGNLDIELDYWNGTEWKTVQDSSEVLDKDALWEPGYTEVVYLRLTNKGSLAVKYQLGVNMVSEIEGVNVSGDAFKLSDYIFFDVVEGVNGETNAYASRKDAVVAATETTKISNGYAQSGTMVAGAAPVYMAMVVYMPETVGNIANHNGKNIPEIQLGLGVFATQLASEEDSFGSDYDDLTLVSNATELNEAVTAGKDKIFLLNNIYVDVDGTAMTVADGKDATINLNGYSIVGTSTAADRSQILFMVEGELTVNGKGGIIFYNNSGAGFNESFEDTAIMARGGVVTLNEGVTVVSDSMGGSMAYAVDVATWGGDSVLNVNGAVLTSSYIAVRAAAAQKGNTATVNYNSGIIQGDRKGYDLWKHDLGGGADAFKINVADGINYDIDTTWGIYLFDLDTTVLSNAAEAQAALDAAASGDKFQLVPAVKYGVLQVCAQVAAENKAPVAANENTYKVDYWTTKYPKGEFARKFEDITITGAVGATVDSIRFVGGTFSVSDVSGTMYRFVEVKNLVIDSVEFTDDNIFSPDGGSRYAPLVFELQSVSVDGLTVTNCTMTGDSNKVNFIYLYGAKAQANYTFPIVAKNVAITNNTVSGIARLAELRATENVTITGNVATNLYKEFAQFSNDAQNPATYAGDIVISDNNVDTIEGFFVVIGNAGDAKVVVKNNTIVNCGRSAEYPQYANLAYTKINSIADGNEPVIENNKVS